MKRRARLSGEKLIMDYLGRLTEAGLYYLPKGSRMAFVGRTKAQIERECGPAGQSDPTRVTEVLAAMGDPQELVRQERTRMDAAWIKSTISDQKLAQATAALVNTPRRYRSFTSRRKPVVHAQPLPRLTDVESMSAPIGTMNDEGDPFSAAKTGGQQPGASPTASARQPTPPAGEPGQAPSTSSAPRAGTGPAGEPVTGPDKEPPRGPDQGQLPGLADEVSGAPSSALRPPGWSPGAAGDASASSPAGGGGAPYPAAGKRGPPFPAGQGAQTGPRRVRSARRVLSMSGTRRLASTTARFSGDQLVPRASQFSHAATELARKHVREAIAIVVLGVGGLILPFPLWLVGAVVAGTSRVWRRIDKWAALAGPFVIALLGAAVTAPVKGGSENAVVLFIDAFTADIGVFLRVGSALTAAFLAWRLYRHPEVKQKKQPPWQRYWV